MDKRFRYEGYTKFVDLLIKCCIKSLRLSKTGLCKSVLINFLKGKVYFDISFICFIMFFVKDIVNFQFFVF